jgi:hypothetical protein
MGLKDITNSISAPYGELPDFSKVKSSDISKVMTPSEYFSLLLLPSSTYFPGFIIFLIIFFSQTNPDHDIMFTYNGTTSGVRVPNLDWIR